jgi:hypothetical protein
MARVFGICVVALAVSSCGNDEPAPTADGTDAGPEASAPADAHTEPPASDAADAHPEPPASDAADVTTPPFPDAPPSTAVDASSDASAGVDAADAAGMVSLWNGVDLAEWEGDPQVWSVLDGAIVGSAANGAVPVNTFLIHRTVLARDFVFRAEVWIDSPGNSGVQYRARRIDEPGFRVGGYQAEVGDPHWGSLYDELGRGWLLQSSACLDAGAAYGKWLAYEIRAQGATLEHRIDGVSCVRYEEAGDGAAEGILALQYHMPGGFAVKFKNLTFAPL